MSARYEHVWESDALVTKVARGFLIPFSCAFGLGVRMRAALYDRGLANVVRAAIAVVSVGNLRVGGSGKTPLVLWLCEKLASAGRRPAIVTRGYGAAAGLAPTIVLHADGARALDPNALGTNVRILGVSDVRTVPADLADEAALLALRGRVPVVVTPDRARGCELAARLGCDVVLLDDGFQHRRLHRDMDIVLTAACDSRARLLPAGPLRESLAALRRADVVITTDDGAPTGSRPSFRAAQAARGLVTELHPDAAMAPLERLRGRAVVAVAGIARPERFLAMLAAAGAELACAPFLFGDHHAYGYHDLATILRAATPGCTIVTTEKDLVKLARLVPAATRLEALRIDLVVEHADVLVERVRDALVRLDAPASGPHHR